MHSELLDEDSIFLFMNTNILVNIFRYYSLPNLKGTTLDVGTVTGQRQYQYQSHPRDEEKRIAYTRGRDR